jgi:hypothetical protein
MPGGCASWSRRTSGEDLTCMSNMLGEAGIAKMTIRLAIAHDNLALSTNDSSSVG